MCTFVFRYSDGTTDNYDGIVQAQYEKTNGTVIVPENELLNHKFPLSRDIWLQSENASFFVSAKNLRNIEIQMEK